MPWLTKIIFIFFFEKFKNFPLCLLQLNDGQKQTEWLTKQEFLFLLFWIRRDEETIIMIFLFNNRIEITLWPDEGIKTEPQKKKEFF